MKILFDSEQRLQDKIQRRLLLNISSEVLYTGGKIQIERETKKIRTGFSIQIFLFFGGGGVLLKVHHNGNI